MKKKVTMTLDPDRHEDLKRLANARGVSVSTLVDELAEIAAEVAADTGATDGSR